MIEKKQIMEKIADAWWEAHLDKLESKGIYTRVEEERARRKRVMNPQKEQEKK